MARIFIFLISLSLFSLEIELFCDYEPHAKGQGMFPLLEGIQESELSLTSLLRRKLLERGDEIRSLELDRYLPLFLSEKKGQEILPSNTKYWMFWNLGQMVKDIDLSKVPKEKLVLVMWEPPVVQEALYDPEVQKHFGKIFTWDDDLVDGKKFFKFHYPALRPRIQNIIPFEEKKFCVMISRRLTSKHPKELYSERKKVIKFFEKRFKDEFDLFGYQWKKGKYKNYKGTLQDKIGKLKEYKFSICYENTKDVKGYISEKIFDCFIAGVVPVYWGASNITDYIPKECFIDRREFSDTSEMVRFLKKITKEEYETYLEHAEKFMKSERAKVFTNEFFVENVLSKL